MILFHSQFSIYFSFNVSLNKISNENSKKLLEITHFVTLFSLELSNITYSDYQKTESEKKRIIFERMKLDEEERKRLEDLDLQEEIRKEKERARNKYSKVGKKIKTKEKEKEN